MYISIMWMIMALTACAWAEFLIDYKNWMGCRLVHKKKSAWKRNIKCNKGVGDILAHKFIALFSAMPQPLSFLHGSPNIWLFFNIILFIYNIFKLWQQEKDILLNHESEQALFFFKNVRLISYLNGRSVVCVTATFTWNPALFGMKHRTKCSCSGYLWVIQWQNQPILSAHEQMNELRWLWKLGELL